MLKRLTSASAKDAWKSHVSQISAAYSAVVNAHVDQFVTVVHSTRSETTHSPHAGKLQRLHRRDLSRFESCQGPIISVLPTEPKYAKTALDLGERINPIRLT